jgi:hypothetical protein
MPGLLLILTTLAVAGLLAAAVASLAQRRAARAVRLGAALLAVVALYTASLLTASVASKPRTLADGQWKCFDEWCATLVSGSHGAGELRLAIGIRNNGRSAERPDAPHAYLVSNGHRTSLAVPGLAQRLGPHDQQTLYVTAALPPRGTRLLITEGGFPSVLSIGDENSPLHAKTAWAV